MSEVAEAMSQTVRQIIPHLDSILVDNRYKPYSLRISFGDETPVIESRYLTFHPEQATRLAAPAKRIGQVDWRDIDSFNRRDFYILRREVLLWVSVQRSSEVPWSGNFRPQQ